MRDHSDLFRQCLEQVDIKSARALWQHVAPNMPCPQSDAEVLVCIHMARTQTAKIPFKLRAYSHGWLIERALPSQLPDHLKPAAERMYPRIHEAVGISVKANSTWMAPLVAPIRTAMENAVLEAYADGKTDPEYIKSRIQEARRNERKKLTGSWGT